jgi:glycosyltransferase involved in cell wall biosynthesis
MNLTAPLVSIITPAYNGETYLRECIDSVLAQTYHNWDYTIVNNCSTDRTLEIAQEYAARDSRIRIHNNETFVRAIPNHNIAFRQISPESKYCKVVAADDWLLPECIERMVALAEKHPSVAIVGAYGHDGQKVLWVGLPYPSTVVPGREVCRSWLLGRGSYVFGNATSVLFRSDIVRSRHALYNESNLHADTELCLELLEHHDFGFVHQVLTYMRVQSGSLTSHSKKFQTYLANNLYQATKYGPIYLSNEETEHAIRHYLRVYYRYLGSQVFERRDGEFWKFHRRRMAEIGYPMSIRRVATAAIARALDLLLNPKRLVEGAVRRWRMPR